MIDGSEEVKGEKRLMRKKRVMIKVVEELCGHPLNVGFEKLRAEQKKDVLLVGAWGKVEKGSEHFEAERRLPWRMAKDRLGEQMRQLVITKRFRTVILFLAH